jgi:hypothetical protein
VGRILKDEHEHDEEDESYFFTVLLVLLLVLVLGCFSIVPQFTKLRAPAPLNKSVDRDDNQSPGASGE